MRDQGDSATQKGLNWHSWILCTSPCAIAVQRRLTLLMQACHSIDAASWCHGVNAVKMNSTSRKLKRVRNCLRLAAALFDCPKECENEACAAFAFASLLVAV